MNILIFTTDAPPLASFPSSGTALRTFGFAQGFRELGHQVFISAPKLALEGLRQKITHLEPKKKELAEKEIDELLKLSFDFTNQLKIIEKTKADLLLCGHWPALTFRQKLSIPIVIDLAGPHMLERHYQGAADQHSALEAKLTALKTADFYIVSGPSQKLYFLSYLIRAGVSDVEKRILNITMPFASTPDNLDTLSPNSPDDRELQFKSTRQVPQKNETSAFSPKFIFAGIFLPWQDPSTSLTNLCKIIQNKCTGKLKIIGGKHASYDIKQGVYTELFETLEKYPFVERLGLVPIEEFEKELQLADVALDLMNWNLERELAITIRTTSYLNAGLPVIYNNFSDLGKLISLYDAGWSIDPQDFNQLKNVFEEITANPEILKKKSKNAKLLSSELFSAKNSVRNLLELIFEKELPAQELKDLNIESYEKSFFVELDSPIEQEFIFRTANFCKLELKLAEVFKDTAHQGEELFEIILKELASKGTFTNPNKTIFQKTYSANELSKVNRIFLEFAPQKNSSGKKYRLGIYPKHETAALLKLCLSRGSNYPLLSYSKGHTQVPLTSLAFHSYFLFHEKFDY